MENRSRRTAILLVATGMYLLFGSLIGYMAVTALVIMWLAVTKIRGGEQKTGYVLLAIGAFMMLQHHFLTIVAIVLISLGFFYIRSKQIHRDHTYLQKQSAIENIKWDKEPWVLRNMSIWYVIGEIKMDFSLAMPEQAEATIVLQGIIADVDIIVPDDIGVAIQASALFGQIKVGGERETGLLSKVVWTSPNFNDCEQKVTVIMSYAIADIDVKLI